MMSRLSYLRDTAAKRRRLREIHHTVLFTRGFTPSDWPVEEQAGFVSEIWGDELEEYQDLSAEMEQRRSELNIAERVLVMFL